VPKVEKPKKVEKAPEEKKVNCVFHCFYDLNIILKVYAAKPDTIDPEYKAKFNA